MNTTQKQKLWVKIISNHRVLSVGFFNLSSGGFLPEPHILAIIRYSKLLMVNCTKSRCKWLHNFIFRRSRNHKRGELVSYRKHLHNTMFHFWRIDWSAYGRGNVCQAFRIHEGLTSIFFKLNSSFELGLIFVALEKFEILCKGIKSNSVRWTWWFQTVFFGAPSTMLMVRYEPKEKKNWDEFKTGTSLRLAVTVQAYIWLAKVNWRYHREDAPYTFRQIIKF